MQRHLNLSIDTSKVDLSSGPAVGSESSVAQEQLFSTAKEKLAEQIIPQLKAACENLLEECLEQEKIEILNASQIKAPIDKRQANQIKLKLKNKNVIVITDEDIDNFFDRDEKQKSIERFHRSYQMFLDFKFIRIALINKLIRELDVENNKQNSVQENKMNAPVNTKFSDVIRNFNKVLKRYSKELPQSFLDNIKKIIVTNGWLSVSTPVNSPRSAPIPTSPIHNEKGLTHSRSTESLADKSIYQKSARALQAETETKVYPDGNTKTQSNELKKNQKDALCLPVKELNLMLSPEMITPGEFLVKRNLSMLTLGVTETLRAKPNSNVVDEILSKYLKSILEIILNHKWELGFFGGKTIWNLNTRTTINIVPKGMLAIADKMRDALCHRKSNQDALNDILELLKGIIQDKSHGFWNRRGESTTIFYTQLQASLSTVKRTLSENRLIAKVG
jgi:hypothetical protein